MTISLYGYAKRFAAIDRIYTGADKAYLDEVLTHMCNFISELHDPLTWDQDVERRVKEMMLSDRDDFDFVL